MPAGLSEVVIIEFRTDTYLDVIDFVQFETNDGIIFEVKLIAYRNAPNLRINVQNQLKNKECNIQVFPQQYDITRAIALNNTIDCGFCFLGSSINISLFMYNEGGVGDFFIMTEDEWYDKNIQVHVNFVSRGVLIFCFVSFQRTLIEIWFCLLVRLRYILAISKRTKMNITS